MQYYPSLHKLLANSQRSMELYHSLPPESKRAMRAHMQSIHTYADLQKIAVLFGAESRRI